MMTISTGSILIDRSEQSGDFLEICMNIILMKMFLFFIYLPIFVISCALTYFVELNTTP